MSDPFNTRRFQVTPQLLRAGIASMTQLPPSPDLKNLASPRSLPDPLSLNESKREDNRDEPSPLDSVARYTHFQPEALACSMPMTASYSDDNNGSAGVRQGKDLPFTSLGAVAGPHGVALFRVSRPHIPLLFLKHESQTSSTGGPGTSLVFQPENGQSLYLASARGSGILVWDVSGNSLNPLAGRLGFEPAVTGSNIANSRITSVAWQPSQPHILAATTPTVASLWDLRSSNGSSSSPSSSVKPVLRFGKSNKIVGHATSGGPSLVHIACSSAGRHTCATMDAKGFVRMFDLRLTGKHNTVVGAVSSFSSFQHAGVGIASFPTSRDEPHSWITWGLDQPDQAVVKVWSPDVSLTVTSDNEDYWYMDGSMEPSLRTCAHLSNSVMGGFSLAAQCTVPGLACARVCPSPIDDHFVTVSAGSATAEGDGWRADVWKLEPANQDGGNGSATFGMERVVSVRGGSSRDTSLRQLLGKSTLGQICGAELALLSSSSIQQRRPSSSAELNRPGEGDDETRLMICCLTANGFVATQHVPQVILKKAETLSQSTVTESPMRGTRLGVRGVLAGSTTRTFNLDKDGFALSDAAGAWNSQTDSVGLLDGRIRTKDDEAAVNPPGSPNVTSDSHLDYDAFQSLPRQPDIGATPFDMDNAMAFGTATAVGAVGDPALQGGVSTSIEEGVPANNEIGPRSDWMEQIDKERVPCPRLCGASFGSGVGGITIFNNGEVKKMWSWYQHTHSRQKPSLPFESIELHFPESVPGARGQGNPTHFILGEKPKSKECPRSFQDLVDMIGTAKEAQWGEVADSSRSTEDEGDDYFEDESLDDGSNSSESLAEEAVRKRGSELESNDPSREEGRPGLVRKGPDSPISSGRKIRGPEAAGPSSDMLTPFVRVKLEFDGLLMNNQSPELATRMKLGDWDVSGQDKLVAVDTGLERQNSPDLVLSSPPSGRNVMSLGQGELPHYRVLFPDGNAKPLVKVKSDPMMDVMPEFLGLPFKGDEPGVHGGEYSVRPGRQESMVFLRKLVTHQLEGGMAYPSLISPPDGPMLPSSLSPLKRNRTFPALGFPVQKLGADDRERSNDYAENTPIGVFTLDGQAYKSKQQLRLNRLIKTRELCAHNATACEAVRQGDKANVWSLLAETVDGLVDNSTDDFSGWGGVGGGALGTGIVQNLLRYYESLGDVQMLSTLVCVLSGGIRNRQATIEENDLLLPADPDDKYDAYIRKYSEILYAWGLLNVRAEINKHLARYPSAAGDELTCVVESLGADRSPGLNVAMTCPRCGVEAKDGNNFCHSCRDFILRCSICSDAVRGLFTMCETCGHGGHTGHLMDWFAKNSDCPTGCGCKCTILTSPHLRSNVSDPLPDGLNNAANVNSNTSFEPIVAADGLSQMREVHFSRITI